MFNDAAAKRFAAILRSDGCIPPINFRMPQHKIDIMMFHRVADALQNGDIPVAVNPRMPKDTAMGYDSFNDVMELPGAYDDFQYIGNMRRSSIVHEAVHAASDLDKLKVLELHDEAAAHLTARLYLLYAGLRDKLEEVAHLETEGNRRIDAECFSIIDRFKLTEPGQQSVPADACRRLADVIGKHPSYRHLRGKLAGCDGVQPGIFRSFSRLARYAVAPKPRQRERQ